MILVVSLTSVFGGCDKDGEPLSSADIDTLAAAVTDLYDEQALYLNGSFSLKFYGTTTYSGTTITNKSLSEGEIAGALEYNETTQDFDMFDADIFITAKETNENFGQVYYVRNGLLFRQFYLGYDKSLADFKKDCRADTEKNDLVYLYDIKDKFLSVGSGITGINSLSVNPLGVKELESQKKELLDTLKPTKFSLVVKNNKITCITAEVATETSDELILDETRRNDKYVSENKINISFIDSIVFLAFRHFLSTPSSSMG